MTTNSKQQQTKESPREYVWLVFYTAVNQWGDMILGFTNIYSDRDLLSVDDKENKSLIDIQQQLAKDDNFRSCVITNIIERR